MGRIKDLAIRASECGIAATDRSVAELTRLVNQTERQMEQMRTIRQSHAFAAHRQAIVLGLYDKLANDCVQGYNARIYDIKNQFTEVENFAKQQPEAARTSLMRLADANLRADLLDLELRRKSFIDGLNKELRASLQERIREYSGEESDYIVHKGTKSWKISRVKFPDGSTATAPRKLFINWSQFDDPFIRRE